ncbi:MULTISPECIES: hypothetical protein [unclassified Rhizobium]|uniref:hypothetical protein n=1 Tax=unclassified Rhizobium TaxID=2613769 RepID=UPI000BE874F8|nr:MULTISPECIES: hypothetical protein [unclassified Rhizobium]MDF0664049.1 hypothetical protein [Rhizobium sp. BC49]PDS79018.1 hypothetical protein CO654_32470 [Rhizobium sp. L18]
MSNTERKATQGMVKFVLTIFVVAMIVAVAYLAFFTPGVVEPGPPKSPTATEAASKRNEGWH